MSVLSDYLNAHIPATMRKTDVVEALHGVVDRATVYKYLAGTHPRNPPEAILQAFADALPQANIVDIRAAVRVPVGTDTPWIPTPEANRLNAGQRHALDLFIKATVGNALDDAEPNDQLAGRVPRADELEPGQLSMILAEVAKLRSLGRDDLADAVVQKLSSTPEGANGSGRPQQPR
ncbi:MAG: hypothetical protein ABI140_01455 [Jatrophihabitantaceae bacterium]